MLSSTKYLSWKLFTIVLIICAIFFLSCFLVKKPPSVQDPETTFKIEKFSLTFPVYALPIDFNATDATTTRIDNDSIVFVPSLNQPYLYAAKIRGIEGQNFKVYIPFMAVERLVSKEDVIVIKFHLANRLEVNRKKNGYFYEAAITSLLNPQYEVTYNDGYTEKIGMEAFRVPYSKKKTQPEGN